MCEFVVAAVVVAVAAAATAAVVAAAICATGVVGFLGHFICYIKCYTWILFFSTVHKVK